jgi:hypothetical protein
MKKIIHSKGKSKEKKKKKEQRNVLTVVPIRVLMAGVRRQRDVVRMVEGGQGRCFWEAADAGRSRAEA